MKLDKINLFINVVLIILVLFLFKFDNQERTSSDNISLEEIEGLREKLDLFEKSIFENKNDEIKVQSIQINDDERIKCVLITKEHGVNGKIMLYDYTGNGELGNVEDIVIDGYDYLKTLGGSKHHIYSGVQCRKDKGWILINGKSSEYSVKEIDGDLRVIKDEFIQENGYFSQRGDVQITCCRVI